MTHQGQIVEIPASSALYKRATPEFLSKKELLLWKSQEIAYSLFDGFLVGGHDGVEHFKLGQRKGIKVGGKKEPLYVIQIDQEENRLFVGAGENHPGLWTTVLSFVKNQLCINKDLSLTSDELENGIRVDILSSVLKEKIPAQLYIFEDELFLEFAQPTLKVIKENTFEVFYQNNKIAEFN